MASNTLNIRVPPDIEVRLNKVCGERPDGTTRSRASVFIQGARLRLDEIEAGLGEPQTIEQMLKRKNVNNARALRKR